MQANIWKNCFLTLMYADFYDKYELATIYFDFEQYTDMQNTIDAIVTNFDLCDVMASDLNDFNAIMNIAKTMKQGNLYEEGLTTEQRQSLENMLANDRPYIAPMALALLKRDNNAYVYQELIYNMPKNSSRKKNPNLVSREEENKKNFKIFPNPALDYVTLSYNCELSNLTYTINDLQSRLIIKGELKTIKGMNTNEVLINLSNLSPGTYQIIIRSNEVIEWHDKLIIAK